MPRIKKNEVLCCNCNSDWIKVMNRADLEFAPKDYPDRVCFVCGMAKWYETR